MLLSAWLQITKACESKVCVTFIDWPSFLVN